MEPVNGFVWTADRLSTNNGDSVGSSLVSGVTLASAENSLFWVTATWQMSAVPNSIIYVQIRDVTSNATKGTISIGANTVVAGGHSVHALIRKTSGTAMELNLRIVGGTASNSAIMQDIHFSILRLGPLDPNELTTANGSATATRPDAP